MTTVTAKFERALGDILARVFYSNRQDESAGLTSSDGSSHADPSDAQASPIAIAYSGGLDSSALLHLACEYASQRSISLFAFHVHHGLSRHADQWLRHCESRCNLLGVRFDARQVKIGKTDGSGIEAAARASRYAALGEMCRAHHVSLLLTAHHQDDQAETVLLQLLRGSGVAGLSGMDSANTAADLLGEPDLILARPLLSLRRDELVAHMKSVGAAHVEDESNVDLRFSRNALRHRVLPALAQYFPGFQERLARTAGHAQSAQRLLDQLAQGDWQLCRDGEGLNVESLRNLDPDRIGNLLRYWLGRHGLRMPSTAWLQQAQAQLLTARDGAQVCITLTDSEIRRYRNRIVLVPAVNLEADGIVRLSAWQGEARMALNEYGGTLNFEAAEQGVDADWLRGQELQIRGYRGEARLKIAPNRSTRSLKSHCQERGIPSWERKRLPLLYVNGELLFVPGIGMACQFLSNGAGPRIRVVWEPGQKAAASS